MFYIALRLYPALIILAVVKKTMARAVTLAAHACEAVNWPPVAACRAPPMGGPVNDAKETMLKATRSPRVSNSHWVTPVNRNVQWYAATVPN